MLLHKVCRGCRSKLKPGRSDSGELIHAHFKISGEAIEQKTSVKHLGVVLDNQMKWKDHISFISSKVSRAIGIIKYSKKLLPLNLLKCYIWGYSNPILDIVALFGAHVGPLPAKP